MANIETLFSSSVEKAKPLRGDLFAFQDRTAREN